MNGRLVPPLAFSALLLIACGGRSAQSGLPAAPPANQNVITAPELRSVNYSNLYDVVRALRPQWLRRFRSSALPGAQFNDLMVYMDRTRLGTMEVLRQLNPSGIMQIRYFSPSEAEAEFGPGNMNGAIQVITSR